MKLNVSEWKEFKVGSILDVINGKGVTVEEIGENPGELLAIQGGAGNNGVLGSISRNYCVNQGYRVIDGGCLTVARVGSAGFVNIQGGSCVVGDKAKALVLPEKASAPLYAFLATILNQNLYKYSYGRGLVTDVYMNELIKLPVLRDPDTHNPILDPNKKYSSEGYIPDFEYMENYITSLKHKPITTACRGADKLQLGIDKWEEFKLSKICSIQMAKSNDKGSLDEGIVPFVGRTASNNGVQCYVDTSDITKGECITVSLVGTNVALWHDADFAASQNIAILRNAVFNVRSALFLCSLLNFVMRGVFSYGRTVNKSDLEAMRLRLPIRRDPKTDKPIIDPNNKYSSKGYIPDFEFMERYIKSLPYGDRLEQ